MTTPAQEPGIAGRKWFYDFEELASVFGDDPCRQVGNRLLQRYSVITKTWNAETNSEWTCRLYLAAKLIMSATLHVNSVYYAEERNLRVVVPYLRYYSVFSLLRAVCYTLPEHHWNHGALIEISHEKAISGALDHLRRFDPAIADTVEGEVRELKAERELISYRAPSVGDDQVSEKYTLISLCTLLAEIAQFNSELFDASLSRHGKPEAFQLIPEHLAKLASVEIDGHYFGDIEDAYRLDYLARKHPRPSNLMHMMKEGHVDDFFGAWVSRRENTDGLFDPDAMKQIIFDIP